MKLQFPSLRTLAFKVVTYGVALHGLFVIGTTLEDQLQVHFTRHAFHVSGFAFDIRLLIGLTLLYVSLLLRRRKRTAWTAAIVIYGVLVILSVVQLSVLHHFPGEAEPLWYDVLRTFAFPCALVAGLLTVRHDFTVKSDLRSFAFSLRFIGLVLLVAFMYGVAGFMFLDVRDFHEDITLPNAMHRTIDRFDLTTTHTLKPYTRRAKVFMDSLTVISVGAVGYSIVSLFQPIRARLTDQTAQRELAERLLKEHPANSEDFFKLWPHDKLYYFNLAHSAGLAYGVRGGVAMAVGDPMGKPEAFPKLLESFADFCRANDWTTAFVHTEPKYNQLYKEQDLSLQKIGEEASLDIAHFNEHVKRNKYFRQITNKFTKQEFATELLMPPHNKAVLSRLTAISNDWLQQPGRAERRFMMGNFTAAYMQECPVMVLRDAAGTIQAFINQVPSFDPEEANFDLLRHTHEAPGNANDFLLMAFIEHAHKQGFKRVNLGLCPLAGLDANDEQRSVVDSALRFLYANGDRFYSFSGLYRFKAKYEPVWTSRYIAYRGGIGGFTRVLNSLNRAMKV
jgi:phosphatidylglycerol lysyltransferase